MTKGFTLIEIAIVILIIAIMANLGIPRFLRIGTTESERFIERLNALVQQGAQAAMQTDKVQKILFNLIAKKVELQDIDSNKSKKSIDIGDIELKDFYINKKSQFMAGSEKYTAYFLINPEGISQEVKIVIVDHKLQAKNPKFGTYELLLNPFIPQFRIS